MWRKGHLNAGAFSEVGVEVKVTDRESACHLDFLRGQCEPHGGVGRIVESHSAGVAPFLENVLGEDVGLTDVLDYVGLKAEPVLVDGDELGVGDDFHCLLRDVFNVAAQQKRRTHDAPDAEMGLLLGIAQAESLLPERGRLDVVADGQHIHVVVVAVSGVGREVEILSDNVFD